MALTFKVEGLEKLLKDLDRLPKEVQQVVEAEIEDFGDKIVAKAKQRVPKDLGGGGGILSAIGARPIQNGVEIFAGKDYAPYVEFGTGGLVDVPAGLEDYAIQFKGKGVRQVNLPARPFFFNSYFEERPEFFKRLENAINERPR